MIGHLYIILACAIAIVAGDASRLTRGSESTAVDSECFERETDPKILIAHCKDVIATTDSVITRYRAHLASAQAHIALFTDASDEHYAGALEHLSHARALNVNDVHVIYGLAVLHGRAGEYATALEYLNGALKADKDNPILRGLRGAAVLRQSESVSKTGFASEYDARLAKSDLDFALDAYPNNVDALMVRARVAHALNDVSGAIGDYSLVIQIEPHNIVAIISRALSFQIQGRWQESIDDYTAAIEIDPLNHQLLVERGNSFMKLSLIDEAVRDYRDALALSPDDLTIRYRLRKAEILKPLD